MIRRLGLRVARTTERRRRGRELSGALLQSKLAGFVGVWVSIGSITSPIPPPLVDKFLFFFRCRRLDRRLNIKYSNADKSLLPPVCYSRVVLSSEPLDHLEYKLA